MQSPLLRSKHMFSIIDPRIDLTSEFLHDIGQNPDFAAVEIPSDAQLPEIIWKFHRRCGEDIHIRNPHFYPVTSFREEVITEISPLRHRGEGKWTEHVLVFGDSKEGRFKLTSQDETIERLFGAVIDCPWRPWPLTVFKGLLASWGNSLVIYTVPTDIEGRMLAEDEVDRIFSSARALKCFRWQDSSFVIDPDVRTVRDVANSSKVRPPCAALDRS